MPKVEFVSVKSLDKSTVKEYPVLLAHFIAFRKVYLKQQDANRIFLQYVRNAVRVLGLWPDEEALKMRFYKLYTTYVILILTIFWSTIAGDVYVAGSDIVALGESIMFLMAVSIVYFKALLLLKNWPSINEIIEILSNLRAESAGWQNYRIKKFHRLYFMGETCVSIFFHIMALFLFVTLSVQPLVSTQTTPIPALFPFNWQDSDKCATCAKCVYIFQVYSIFHALLIILYVDTLGVACITQTSLNLRILSLRLRELGLNSENDLNMLDELRTLVEFHQRVIAVNEKCNASFYGTYILQMGSSTFMLGLAGFETLYAKDQPMVAFKFLFFMWISMSQLLYWCMVGNIVYFDSQDVSVAAFEAHEWFKQSPVVQRNIMFLIMRAQKPLVFRAKPLMPFTFETFTKIIKTSYTSFTLLCNTSE